VPEVVYVQHLMGVDGVIVDLVLEIAEAVSAFTVTAVQASGSQVGGGIVVGVGERMETAAAAVAAGTTPSFSPREMSFLLRLIPELVR
jgi:pantothenate kinase type III